MDTVKPEHLFGHKRNGFLVLLMMLLSIHFIPELVSVDNRLQFLLACYTLVLFSSMYLVAYKRKELIIGLILVMPIIVTNWYGFGLSNVVHTGLNSLFYIIFLFYLSIHIFRYLFETNDVSRDMIYAALCLYFIIGLIWSFIYLVIEVMTPGSFSFSNELTNYKDKLTDLTYYSYVTLSTLGYGDMAPLSRSARSWAVFESIIGQFYLAVVVARLVALHLTAEK